MTINDYLLNTIKYIKVNILNDKDDDFEYKFNENEKYVNIKLNKKYFNKFVEFLKEKNIEFNVFPTERKVSIKFPFHNGKRLLKTKFFNMDVYFMDDKYFIKDKNNVVKSWIDFFEAIDPEYLNLMERIVDNIELSVFRNEKGMVISKKTFYLDPKNGLYEKKEKLINGEWKITYQPVTSDVFKLFRLIFKFYDKVEIEKLLDFEFFKEIVSKTKYYKYLK